MKRLSSKHEKQHHTRKRQNNERHYQQQTTSHKTAKEKDHQNASLISTVNILQKF